MAENAERRSRLQRMNESSADEPFVRGEKLKLAVYQREELFFQRGLAQTRVFADRSNRLVYFLLEEMQSDVFLGPEIIEDGAFSNPGLARYGFSCRSVKAPGLKERQGGRHDALPNRRFVLRAPAHRTLHPGSASARLRCGGRLLLCGHSTIREYAHLIYERTHGIVKRSESLSRHHADVGNRRALRHRRHSADIQHDPGDRSAGFEDYLAEIVRDVTNFHSLLDITAAFNQRIEHSCLFAGDGHDLLDPDWMLDHCRSTRQHLQIAHHAQAAVNQRIEIICLNRAGVSRLSGD